MGKAGVEVLEGSGVAGRFGTGDRAVFLVAGKACFPKDPFPRDLPRFFIRYDSPGDYRHRLDDFNIRLRSQMPIWKYCRPWIRERFFSHSISD